MPSSSIFTNIKNGKNEFSNLVPRNEFRERSVEKLKPWPPSPPQVLTTPTQLCRLLKNTGKKKYYKQSGKTTGCEEKEDVLLELKLTENKIRSLF